METHNQTDIYMCIHNAGCAESLSITDEEEQLNRELEQFLVSPPAVCMSMRAISRRRSCLILKTSAMSAMSFMRSLSGLHAS